MSVKGCVSHWKALAFMTMSKEVLPVLLMVVVVVCTQLFCWRRLVFFVFLWQEDVSRGRVFLNILTMRIFIGNMMRELCTPTMNCCQVNSKWPEYKDLMRLVCFWKFIEVFWSINSIRCTQVHDLIRGVCWDPIKHDAGQHGAEQQGETAGHPLYTSKGAAWWSIDHRVPKMSVTEIPCRLH